MEKNKNEITSVNYSHPKLGEHNLVVKGSKFFEPKPSFKLINQINCNFIRNTCEVSEEQEEYLKSIEQSDEEMKLTISKI